MMLVLFAKNASAVDYSFSDAYTSFLMPIICEIKNKIGGTLLVLDCEANHSDLVQYYKKKSFVPIHIGDNDKSGLEKMILRI